MKRFLLIILLLAFVAGCNGAFTAERVREINDQWWKMYQSDRRLTKAEAEEYAALDDEGKAEWRKGGKPADKPLSPRMIDAAKDFHKAVGFEVDAAKD